MLPRHHRAVGDLLAGAASIVLRSRACWLRAPARSLSPVTITPPETICTTASKRFAGAISICRFWYLCWNLTHKEVCYRRREHWNEAVRKLIGYFDHSFLEILSTIKQITESAQLDDAEKVGQIRSLLAAEEPDRHQAEASLAPLKRDLESETDGEDYYGILEAKSIRIQNRLSPILKALPFQGEAGSEASCGFGSRSTRRCDRKSVGASSGSLRRGVNALQCGSKAPDQRRSKGITPSFAPAFWPFSE